MKSHVVPICLIFFFLSLHVQEIGEKNPPERIVVVEQGDTVVMDWAIFINGHIVDASVEMMARNVGAFCKETKYRPAVVTVGKRGENALFPNAVEREILGMRVGEQKLIEVYPPDAYGYWDEQKVIKVSEEEYFKRTGCVQGHSLPFDGYAYLDLNHWLSVNATTETVSRSAVEGDVHVGALVMYQGGCCVVLEVRGDEVVLDVDPYVFMFKIRVIYIEEAVQKI